MSTIAIITARGGSKRIPHKNIVPVAGKPLLAWSIEAALNSGVCDRVLVSTDCPEIAATAIQWGAAAPFLRTSASDDEATASEACLASLAQAEEFWNESYEHVVLLMPTCPLRTAYLLRAQYEAFLQMDCDFLLSCAGFGPTKPWWAFTMDEQGQASYLHPDALKIRSQLLPKSYAPSGATWIARTKALRESQTFYGAGHRFHVLSWIAAIDIDEPGDISLIEALVSSGLHLEQQVD